MSTIITKGIDGVRRKYLKKIRMKSIRGISVPKATELFLLIIKDFKKGTLSPDELSSFGFEIFHGTAKHHPDIDLFQASLSASDLRSEIRTGATRIPECIKDIDDFYDKHK